jgi:hypothetical protein
MMQLVEYEVYCNYRKVTKASCCAGSIPLQNLSDVDIVTPDSSIENPAPPLSSSLIMLSLSQFMSVSQFMSPISVLLAGPMRAILLVRQISLGIFAGDHRRIFESYP